MKKEWKPRRFLLRLAYEGTGYHGWQRQPGLKTIQGALETALSDFFGEALLVDGASRTDAGVHAADQLVAFTVAHPISPQGLVKVLNQRLPTQLSLRSAEEVSLSFQPRFENHGKRYRYRLYLSRQRDPLLDRFAWAIPWSIDWLQLMEAAEALIGTHDFQSFAARNGQHKSSVRRLWSISLYRHPAVGLHSDQFWALEFCGDAFLKQMIRNLVGTLVEVGRGHWTPSRIPEVLAARERSAAGPTAPARGLTLSQIYWPNPPSHPRPR
ncbi:MAG: tRNA pseudouridine(38-40) synthase TruA [Myxococcota bacterium]|nr:tRNA pseudouridine(38-40) synthase TruA [Myxococcota bacterium]